MFPTLIRRETNIKKQTRHLLSFVKGNQEKYANNASAPIHFFVIGLGAFPLPKCRQSIGQVVVNNLVEKLGVKLESDRHAKCTYGSTLIDLDSNAQNPDAPSQAYVSFLLPEGPMFQSGGPVRIITRQLFTPGTAQMYFARNLKTGNLYEKIWQQYNKLLMSRCILLHDTMELGKKTCMLENMTLDIQHNGVVDVLQKMKRDLSSGRIELGIGNAGKQEGKKEGRYLIENLSEDELDYWKGEGRERVWALIKQRIRDVWAMDFKHPYVEDLE